MENFSGEYSKFLDETGSHLSLQSLAAYINLPDKLSDKERQFISNHLADCTQCSNAFNSIFDEGLNLDENKNVISLFRQSEESDEQAAIIRSEDNLVEIQITRISPSDFNLRFISLPSGFNNQKAALKYNSGYILRVLSMNIDTMFIVHSENDILNQEIFELVTPAVPVIIPPVLKSERSVSRTKFIWFAAAAIILSAAVLLIYYATRPGEEIQQNEDESSQIITSLTPGQKSVTKTDSVVAVKPVPAQNEITPPEQTPDLRDNFAENSILENIIGNNNSGEPQVEIISPSVGTDVKMPVRFEWMTARKNMTLRFVILTNQNIPVYESLINGNQLTIDTKLEPGLYYWKLEFSDTNKTISKFFIR